MWPLSLIAVRAPLMSAGRLVTWGSKAKPAESFASGSMGVVGGAVDCAENPE